MSGDRTVFKSTGISIPVRREVFDACAHCGEPIVDGLAVIMAFGELAFHEGCEPGCNAMRSFLRDRIGDAGASSATADESGKDPAQPGGDAVSSQHGPSV